jgi:DNA-binding HxlR family transcriptional regulator
MAKGYGQFCPLSKAAELLCERWTMILVRELAAGSRRFNDLRRGMPLISPTLLSRRLKQLVNAGVVTHVTDPSGATAYELTRAGRELRPLVDFMGTWGHRWVGSQLREEDLDVSLLMWDIRRGVDAARFPPHRVVVQFRFSDAPEGRRDWWLVSEDEDTDLCMEDPGHEVDLLVHGNVRSLTAIWLCRTTLAEARRRGTVEVLGDRQLGEQLPVWLQGSPLARLGEDSLRENPI